MKKVRIFVAIILITFTASCSTSKNKVASNLTIPEDTKYFIMGSDIDNDFPWSSKHIMKNFIFYFSENGEMLGKELLFNDAFFHFYSYNNGSLYVTGKNNELLDISLSTGEIDTILTMPEKGVEILYVESKGEKLFWHYSIYDEKYNGNKDSLCVLNLNQKTEKTCVDLAESNFEVFVVKESVFVWNYAGQITEFDYDLREIKNVNHGIDGYPIHDEENLYIIYSDGIYDVINEEEYNLDLSRDYYEYYVQNGELILVKEGIYSDQDTGSFVQAVYAYDVKNGDELRQTTLEEGYYFDLFYLGGEKYIAKYDIDKATVIPFNLSTFEKSDTKMVIEFENGSIYTFVYGLYMNK
jgi:hypothetical protein